MKKKLLLMVILLIFVGMVGVNDALADSYATDPALVDIIDWSIVEKGCVKLPPPEDEIERVPYIEDKGIYRLFPKEVEAVNQYCLERQAERNSVVERYGVGIRSLRYIDDYMSDLDYNRKCALRDAAIAALNEGKKLTYDEMSSLDFNPYEYSKHELLNFWISKRVVAVVPGECRRLFSRGNGGLNLITFDPLNIDLFGEECTGWLGEGDNLNKPQDQYTKTYGIRYAYKDHAGKYVKYAPYEANCGEARDVSFFATGRTTFFVCKDHNVCGSCNNIVASNGATFDYYGTNALAEIEINKYCPENHACGFFWDTYNTNNAENNNVAITYIYGTIKRSVEGLSCTENKREDKEGCYFCPEHACDVGSCRYPIIGTNIYDGVEKEPKAYEGDVPGLYSRYCMQHFCWEKFCRDQRVNANSTDVTKENDTGLCTRFPEYCSEHYNNHYMNCTKYGCDNDVNYRDYEKDGENDFRYLCPTHMEEEPKFVECSWCHNSIQEEFSYSFNQDVTLCSTCLARNYGKEIEVIINNGSVVEVTVLVPEGAGSGAGSGEATCNHALYPVPASVTFEMISYSQHNQYWTCTNCNKYLTEAYNHTYINGICVCGKTSSYYGGGTPETTYPDYGTSYPNDGYGSDYETQIEPEMYQITFDANGGVGEMAPQTFLGIEVQTLPLNTFVREGYVFMGWAIDPGHMAYLPDGAKCLIFGDVTLYAIWDLI